MAGAPGTCPRMSGVAFGAPAPTPPTTPRPLVLGSAELESASSLQVKLVCNIFRTSRVLFSFKPLIQINCLITCLFFSF